MDKAEVIRTTFPKSERLVSQKLIDQLFTGGKNRSLSEFPLRLVYSLRQRQEGDEPVQLLISVPKKHFHHAVDRNRVKRQLREAYRHCRQPLFTALPSDRSLQVALLWLSDRHYDTAQVFVSVDNLFDRLVQQL
jgi:ribonuclease P protein component